MAYLKTMFCITIDVQLYGMLMLSDYDNDNFANYKSFIVACNLCIPIYRVNVYFCHTTNVHT